MSVKNVIAVVAFAALSTGVQAFYPPEYYTYCTACTNAGFTWQKEANQCTDNCAIADISCARTPAACKSAPPKPTPKPPSKYTYCSACTQAGYTWQKEANACTYNCDIADIPCVRQPAGCKSKPKPSPSSHKNCKSCTGAGFTWQIEANQCTLNCAIQDISCQRSPSQCSNSPGPKPCDCTVDLRGSPYSYINIWKRKPCSGVSFGALYHGRCLYFAGGRNGNSRQEYLGGKEIRCGFAGGAHTYLKMKTESGKSIGWVAEDFLACRHNNKPAPAPAPAPASASPFSSNNNNA